MAKKQKEEERMNSEKQTYSDELISYINRRVGSLQLLSRKNRDIFLRTVLDIYREWLEKNGYAIVKRESIVETDCTDEDEINII